MQDLVLELHDQLEKEKCIKDLQHVNQDLVEQISELSSTKGMLEDWIRPLQISALASICASTPALVGMPKLSSHDISEIQESLDMLKENTQPIS